MFSIPDVSTLGLCSLLASTAFLVVYLTLWRIRPGQTFLLDWAGSSGTYVVALAGFALLPDRPATTAFLYALLGLCDVLILAGVRRFDGAAPVRPWMLLLILLPSLSYLVPSLLWTTREAQMGGILGLAGVMLVVGAVLIRGGNRAKGAAGGRRIAGGALLGYIPPI